MAQAEGAADVSRHDVQRLCSASQWLNVKDCKAELNSLRHLATRIVLL